MKLIITGTNFTLTEGVKAAVKDKLKKIEKLVGEEAAVEVKLNTKAGKVESCKVELTVRFDKNIVRAEVVDHDMYKAIGTAVDTTAVRIKKLKGKMKKKAGEKSIRDVKDDAQISHITEDDEAFLLEFGIAREKFVAAEVMTRDEACVEMEYTDHDFYIFKDAYQDEDICIIYRRTEGGYGLLKVSESL